MSRKKKKKKKILGKKYLGKKKNLGKKNLGKKKMGEKNWPKKGHKLAAIGLSSFTGGDILKSCAQTKFEAKWLKIAL